MKKRLFCVCVLMGALVACQNDLEEFAQPESLMTKSAEVNSLDLTDSVEYYTLNVIYKNRKFTTECKLINDSTIIYLNEEFENFYEENIKLNPNLVTVINPDGSVEYFDNVDDSNEALQLQKIESSEIMPLAEDAGYLGLARLWDDVNFKDRIRPYNASMTTGVIVNNLDTDEEEHFNDKTSAIQVYYTGTNPDYCAVLNAYENKNQSGRKLVCIATLNKAHIHSNLKLIPCGDGNWNDRISSLRFEISNVGRYQVNH